MLITTVCALCKSCAMMSFYIVLMTATRFKERLTEETVTAAAVGGGEVTPSNNQVLARARCPRRRAAMNGKTDAENLRGTRPQFHVREGPGVAVAANPPHQQQKSKQQSPMSFHDRIRKFLADIREENMVWFATLFCTQLLEKVSRCFSLSSLRFCSCCRGPLNPSNARHRRHKRIFLENKCYVFCACL